MPLKLKIGGGGGGGGGQQAPTPSTDPTAPKPAGGFKLKLSNSQPPTPATEQASASMAPPPGDKKKRVYHRKDKDSSKKRPAEDSALNPAAKRIASDANVADQRRGSLIKLKTTQPAAQPSAAPSSAGPRLKINKRPPPTPAITNVRLNVKGRVPERQPGNGYDSEDSERERDPATEQQLILRMQPGEDCDYLREAIAEKRIGPGKNDADVSIKFLDRDYRRCIVGIRRNYYAAALVDLPCIVETMKSWDKKGWWKVSDMHQMLLVLGRCSSDDEARSMPLPPRVVDPATMQYAHGLTPPMHHARKRRFRKRLSYKDTANVEEEVQRLLDEDERAEAAGGEVVMEIHNRDSLERSLEPPEPYYDDDADADADADEEAVSTIEDGFGLQQQLEAEMDVEDVAAQMNAAFDEDAAEDDPEPGTTEPSPAPLAAQPLALPSDTTPADTPAPQPTSPSDSDESDYDSDDSEDGVDVVDEDAVARAAERAQQMEEVKDLEREVEIQRGKLAGQRNQLLKRKLEVGLASLEEDLRIKRAGAGVEEEG